MCVPMGWGWMRMCERKGAGGRGGEMYERMDIKIKNKIKNKTKRENENMP